MSQPYRFGSLLSAETIDDWDDEILCQTNPLDRKQTEKVYSPSALAETDLG